MLSYIRPFILLGLVSVGIGAYAATSTPEPPLSPPPSEWAFVDALAAPVMWNPHWQRSQPKSGEVDLKTGVRIDAKFPNSEGLLDSAYKDLQAFLLALHLSP